MGGRAGVPRAVGGGGEEEAQPITARSGKLKEEGESSFVCVHVEPGSSVMDLLTPNCGGTAAPTVGGNPVTGAPLASL
eukprot:1962335-Pyramimonas_sp.AAC.1